MGKLSKKALMKMANELYVRLGREEYDVTSLPLRTYHRFEKYTIKPTWYADLADPADVMVEIAIVYGSHEKLHYHKESHAVNIIMGEPQGVSNPPYGSTIVAGKTVLPARSGKTVYFPEKLPHTFHSVGDQPLYFLSIQSPPLERYENGEYVDDFHWV